MFSAVSLRMGAMVKLAHSQMWGYVILFVGLCASRWKHASESVIAYRIVMNQSGCCMQCNKEIT
jgi:hypothetical protein